MNFSKSMYVNRNFQHETNQKLLEHKPNQWMLKRIGSKITESIKSFISMIAKNQQRDSIKVSVNSGEALVPVPFAQSNIFEDFSLKSIIVQEQDYSLKPQVTTKAKQSSVRKRGLISFNNFIELEKKRKYQRNLTKKNQSFLFKKWLKSNKIDTKTKHIKDNRVNDKFVNKKQKLNGNRVQLQIMLNKIQKKSTLEDIIKENDVIDFGFINVSSQQKIRELSESSSISEDFRESMIQKVSKENEQSSFMDDCLLIDHSIPKIKTKLNSSFSYHPSSIQSASKLNMPFKKPDLKNLIIQSLPQQEKANSLFEVNLLPILQTSLFSMEDPLKQNNDFLKKPLFLFETTQQPQIQQSPKIEGLFSNPFELTTSGTSLFTFTNNKTSQIFLQQQPPVQSRIFDSPVDNKPPILFDTIADPKIEFNHPISNQVITEDDEKIDKKIMVDLNKIQPQSPQQDLIIKSFESDKLDSNAIEPIEHQIEQKTIPVEKPPSLFQFLIKQNDPSLIQEKQKESTISKVQQISQDNIENQSTNNDTIVQSNPPVLNNPPVQIKNQPSLFGGLSGSLFEVGGQQKQSIFGDLLQQTQNKQKLSEPFLFGTEKNQPFSLFGSLILPKPPQELDNTKGQGLFFNQKNNESEVQDMKPSESKKVLDQRPRRLAEVQIDLDLENQKIIPIELPHKTQPNQKLSLFSQLDVIPEYQKNLSSQSEEPKQKEYQTPQKDSILKINPFLQSSPDIGRAQLNQLFSAKPFVQNDQQKPMDIPPQLSPTKQYNQNPFIQVSEPQNQRISFQPQQNSFLELFGNQQQSQQSSIFSQPQQNSLFTQVQPTSIFSNVYQQSGNQVMFPSHNTSMQVNLSAPQTSGFGNANKSFSQYSQDQSMDMDDGSRYPNVQVAPFNTQQGLFGQQQNLYGQPDLFKSAQQQLQSQSLFGPEIDNKQKQVNNDVYSNQSNRRKQKQRIG